MKNSKLFIFSGLALVSVVIVRCIQIVFLIEPRTGFYIDGMSGIGSLLSVFAALIIVFAGLLGFFTKPNGVFPRAEGSFVLGCAALLAGLAHLLEPFIGTVSPDSVPIFLAILRLIMILAAGGVFCYFGIAFLLHLQPRFSFTIVLILAWVVRLMSTFISFTGMSNISENLYDALMLIMTLVFLLFQGKQLCGTGRSHGDSQMVAVGVMAILLTAISALPGVIVSLIGATEVNHRPIDSPLSCLFTALYIGIYLVKICCLPAGEEKQKKAPEKPNFED